MKPSLRITLWVIGVFVVQCAAWLLWWWFGGAHSSARAVDCFVYGGLIVAGIGLLSLVGALRGTMGHLYQHASSASPEDSAERAERDWEYRRKGGAISTGVMVTGLLNMGVGGLVHLIAS